MKLRMRLLTAGAVACVLALPVNSQGVPTIDVTSLAKLAEQLTEAKLQLREQVAQNLKLDEQTRQLLEQIMLLQNQIDALRNGLTLADLGVEPMPMTPVEFARFIGTETDKWTKVIKDAGVVLE